MSATRTVRNLSLSALLLGVMIFAGCFASRFTLIPVEQAKVDRAYVGDWEAVNSNGDKIRLIIRNLDDRLYYIEAQEKLADPDPDRYTGFIASVGGATFAHVKPLQKDGTIDENWMLMRVMLADDKLIIQQLDEEFMKTQTIESAEQLKQVIEKNVNNEAMYDKPEEITATRVAS